MVTDAEVKEELFAHSTEPKDDFFSAVLSLGGELGKDEKGYYLFYSSHDYRLAVLLSEYLKRVYSFHSEIGILLPDDKRRKRSFTLTVRGRTALSLLSDLGKIRVLGNEITFFDGGLKSDVDSVSDASAYVRGVYLSCGSLSRASGATRLSLAFEAEEYADQFQSFLDAQNIALTKREKDGKYYLTSRKGQAISDFFAFAGASKTVIAVQNKMVTAEFKNKIQRVSNLSVANMDKSMSASVKQYNDAIYIKAHTSFYGVPEEIVIVAKARIAHPEATLEELRLLLPEPISKSGLYHRLAKIGELANAIREENHENNG